MPRAHDLLDTVTYTARRVRRHVQWAREEGIGRLIEEDQLDPRARISTAVAKARWRRSHGVRAGSAVPVYVVGLQRSGTNMLLRGFDAAPEVEVRGENDRTVFDRFRLRSTDVLVKTVQSSRHQLVLVKPLCDSQQVDRLLDLEGMPPGRAIWAWRDPYDRARSEVSKFGDSNLQALRAIADGTDAGLWQGERLPESSREVLRSFDVDAMTPETAAVVFWALRNLLYFDLGLAGRDDVFLSSYDALVRDPAGHTRRLCAFLSFPYRGALHEHIRPRDTFESRPLDIDPRAAALADDVSSRLAATEAEHTNGRGQDA